jgi:hypothetical protein
MAFAKNKTNTSKFREGYAQKYTPASVGKNNFLHPTFSGRNIRITKGC